jgi:DNA-binding MarR family transcriptional regulator
MADINDRLTLPLDAKGGDGGNRAGSGRKALRRSNAELLAFAELLFFAYRDFTRDPDAILQDFGFGRAHHRVLHFVNRHSGLRVADLLDALKITKQSLGRVLKQLIDTGHIEQRPGPLDRRQRLLFATEKGSALALRLIDLQTRRVRAAVAAMSTAERAGAEEFLRAMIDPAERANVRRLIER